MKALEPTDAQKTQALRQEMLFYARHITETGHALNQHVDATMQFASNPMLGIEKIKEMFDQTFQAMDAMDGFRTKAIDVMGQNNQLIRDQLARAETYVDRTRQNLARDAAAEPRTQAVGPVKM